MKLPSRVDSSVCGAVLSSQSHVGLVGASPRVSTTSRRLCQGRYAPIEPLTMPQIAAPAHKPLSCSRSSTWLWATFAPELEKHRTAGTLRSRHPARDYSTAAAAALPMSGTRQLLQSKSQPPPPSLTQDKEKLLSYVDQIDEGTVEEYFAFHRDSYRRGYAAPDGPKLEVSEKKDDVDFPTRDETININDDVRQILGRLYSSIGQRLRHPHRNSLEPIYRLYRELPEPRMLYLTGQWRGRLLKVMGTPRKRDVESMLRYFALVADVKNAGLTLRRTQWNFAMAFATKYTARATTQEMESALRLWGEMERDAKIMGNDVTFNVLFDVAAKAGNFTLAEMIYKEMETRGVEFNRYHHVSLIHYFGLRLDSGGVRAAYKEMVESGEMIDTVTLNCVISGFLRCGEEAAAEETYQRMKTGHSLAPDMPQRDYMMNKVVTKVLMMFSKVGKQHPQLKQALQTNVQLSPDLHTYRLMIDHYAIRVGSLPKVAQYLDEMKHLNIPINPTIFLVLFKGFYLHGGYPGSDWSQQRLEGVLSALYQAHDEQAKAFQIGNWVVIWALRAVKRCSTTEALIHTFDSMSHRWTIKPERQHFMHAIFENILHDKDLTSARQEGLSYQKREKDTSWL